MRTGHDRAENNRVGARSAPCLDPFHFPKRLGQPRGRSLSLLAERAQKHGHGSGGEERCLIGVEMTTLCCLAGMTEHREVIDVDADH